MNSIMAFRIRLGFFIPRPWFLGGMLAWSSGKVCLFDGLGLGLRLRTRLSILRRKEISFLGFFVRFRKVFAIPSELKNPNLSSAFPFPFPNLSFLQFHIYTLTPHLNRIAKSLKNSIAGFGLVPKVRNR